MPVETLTFRADISNLRKELGKVPGITEGEAKRMVIAMERQLKKAEKAAKRVASETKKANQSAMRASERAAEQAERALKDMGSTAGDTESSLKAVAGAIGLISPEAEQALNSIGDLSGGVEGLTRGTGLLGGNIATLGRALPIAGVALAALGTAALVVMNHTQEAREEMSRYQAAIDDTDASTRLLVQSQNALKLATGDVAGFVGDLQIQAALMAGEIEQADMVAGRLGGTLSDKLRPRILEAGKAFADNEMRIQRLNQAIDSNRLSTSEMVKAQAEIGQARGAREGLQAQLDAVKALGSEGRDAINEYASAIERKNEADKGGKGAAKQVKAEGDSIQELMADVAELQAIREAAAESQRSQTDSILAARNKELDRLDVLIEKHREEAEIVQEAQAARLEVIEAAEMRVTEIQESESEKRIEAARREAESELAARTKTWKAAQALQEQQARDQEMLAEATRSSWESVASGAGDVFGEMAANVSEKSRSAALALFNIEKGLRVGEILMDTQRAAMAALLPPPVGLGPVAGVGLATAIGAVGLAKAGLVTAEQPRFHTGRAGVGAGMGPGESVAVVRDDERMLTPQGVRAMGGDAAVDRANQGGGSGGAMAVQLVLSNRVVDTMFYEAAKRPSPTSTSNSKTGRVMPYRRS